MPCADREDCNEFRQTAASRSAHQQEHSNEMCTPFCVCSCCAVHALLIAPGADIDPGITVITIYTHHPSPGIRGAIIPIWQPPKLA